MKPVIDVHTHIFNARDIPAEGYLRSREPIYLIEKLLGLCGLKSILIPSIAKCLREKLDREKKENILSNRCKLTMAVVYAGLGQQYKEWADTLSKEVIDITKEMINTYQKDKIDLYVPLMVDYEYWFKNTPDNSIKEQIEHIYNNIVLPYKGKIHPFVAFDPAREIAFRKHMLNPDRKPELYGSLQLVKDAIENKGFIGVKLYNAMGYKPFNNETVDDKRRRRIGLHKKMGYHIFKGEEYDEVLSELYDYCVDNQVPITTHCGMYGIESYHNASFDFGQAVFWHEVLSQKKYKDLHLNLAHFGWCQQHRYHGNKGWVKDICEMLTEYEYLFTDVAHHSVLLEKNNRRFKSDYEDMRRDWSDYRGKDCWSKIKKKILFGIDWHIIKRVKKFEQFKDKYVKILKHRNLFTNEEIDDFLGGNAVKFLGLLPKAGKRKKDGNWERLKKFYKNHKIDPPKWFKSTGKLNNSNP
jgi:predicted TIM-barrel fold metal-dependent hydrolase